MAKALLIDDAPLSASSEAGAVAVARTGGADELISKRARPRVLQDVIEGYAGG